MKSKIFLAAVLAAMATNSASSQGTFVYDQQSSTDEFIPGYGGGTDMEQIPPPWGQSFTPSLAGVDFIRLKITANSINLGLANMYLNLHADSIDGPVIGATESVILQTGFHGNPNFFFPSRVALAPGVAYYFEPMIQVFSGSWRIIGGPYLYPGGSAYVGGAPQLASDAWFREGLFIVPEPVSALLLMLGSGLLGVLRRSRPEIASRPVPSGPWTKS